MKQIQFLLLSVLSCALSQAVVAEERADCRKHEEYKVPGRYEGQSAQGMDIWKDHAFLLNDRGFCRVYDFMRERVVGGFPLGSYHRNNHANCASFGVEYPAENTAFPALYVSECRKPYRCFVESVRLDGATLVQTIRYREGDKESVVHDWIVDRQKKKLYAVTRSVAPKGKNAVDSVCIIRFRLPALGEGDVTLSGEDAETRFAIALPNLLQGGTIHRHRLYLPVGLHAGNEHRSDARRAMIVVDLRCRCIAHIIDLEDAVRNEPEDAAFWGGRLMLFCGQTGGIHRVKK